MQVFKKIGRTMVIAAAASVALLATSAASKAAVVNVGAFGDQGWSSDDTRNSAGVNLVGTVTNAPRPGQTPTVADDIAIAQQIKFVDGPAGSTYGGAVSIDGTATGSGKSNYSVINATTGFAPATSLLLPSFEANYEMYKQHTGAGSTLAFKIGIQSAAWGTGPTQSQNGFTATRSGESVWDLVLVHVPAVTNNTWTEVNLDTNTGTWTLFRQAGNANLPATPPNGQPGSDKTLDGWLLDPTWGPLLFGGGAKISSVQFGLGSGQAVAIGYVDYLQTNILNGGDRINFVPEPASLSLLAMGGCAMLRRRRR